MKKLFLLATLVFGMNTHAQTNKAETFAIENGLEIVLSKGEIVIAKETMVETLHTITMASFSYTIDITYSISSEGAKVTKIENTRVSNNGFVLDLTTYRGLSKTNLTKKQWEKLVASVNAKAESTLSKF